jgi:hypothetical protein
LDEVAGVDAGAAGIVELADAAGGGGVSLAGCLFGLLPRGL